MRKSLLYLSLFIFASSNSKAQVKDNLSFGPIAGFGHSWFSDKEDNSAAGKRKFKASINVGARLIYSIHPHWALGSDLTFRTEGSNFVFYGNDSYFKTTMNYVRLDPKLFYFFNGYGSAFRPKIGIGPSLGFLIGGKIKTPLVFEREPKVKDLYEPLDLGISGSIGFNYRIKNRTWLNVDAVYNQGLTDNIKNNPGNSVTRNGNIFLNVGVAFGIGHVKTKK